MKKTTAANIALALAPVAWLMILSGGLMQMGDPHPDISKEAIRAARLVPQVVLIAGLAALFASIGLTIFGRAGARKRCTVALGLGLGPFALLVGSMLWSFGRIF